MAEVTPNTYQFWKDLPQFQLGIYPDVPIFIPGKKVGPVSSVWPYFYKNKLAQKPRVQIVHCGEKHVALFIKKVKAEVFCEVVQPLLEKGIHIGDPGGAWQSVKIYVAYVDSKKSVVTQIKEIKEVFEAARRLYDFFIKHEAALLAIPTFK